MFLQFRVSCREWLVARIEIFLNGEQKVGVEDVGSMKGHQSRH